eukprot:CAMPEP_0180261450 /NCGR_PEP_ID=MMETSP0987-20121128/44151_1 /TAXON_ID=697907 /ORGANISM="non described non described, Strain CCMP2293" /LENGTH=40 /DNA_ID= /DNA_START= /DNA_END= /DNA_ORIENTATION=
MSRRARLVALRVGRVGTTRRRQRLCQLRDPPEVHPQVNDA